MVSVCSVSGMFPMTGMPCSSMLHCLKRTVLRVFGVIHMSAVFDNNPPVGGAIHGCSVMWFIHPPRFLCGILFGCVVMASMALEVFTIPVNNRALIRLVTVPGMVF